ncbi:MAG: type I-E CRISPR-associated protein Cas5/CasD [Acidimicrobiales bacterium]
MSVLLLRLAGPLQSWGARGRFVRRTTSPAPTKSAVLGLLAAAQGRRRTDPIEDLLELRFGVRVDQPGTLLQDFHTVSRLTPELPTAKGSSLRNEEANKVTYRQYLEDAVFLAGVEGKRELLAALDDAIRHPRFFLYLGRRSCPPLPPLSLGVVGGSLEQALSEQPWQAARWFQRRTVSEDGHVDLEVIVDDPQGEPLDPDVPLSFDPHRRSHAVRRVRREQVRVAVPPPDVVASSSTHDPFGLL